MQSQSESRSAVYRILAELWAAELSTDSPLLRDEALAEQWRALGGIVPDGSSEGLSRLAEDFCRLFIGPKDHLPPIQSVWIAGELQSEVVESLKEFHAVCRIEPFWPELFSDHLANELLLMSVSVAATESSDSAAAACAVEVCAAFFERHLAWATPFLGRVIAQDADGFYGSLASVTDSFLRSEQPQYDL